MRYTDNFDQDGEDFDEAEEAAMAEAMAQSNKNHEEQLKLADKQLKHDLLDKSVFISKSWFWGLLPQAVRLHRVSETYETLKKLVD